MRAYTHWALASLIALTSAACGGDGGSANPITSPTGTAGSFVTPPVTGAAGRAGGAAGGVSTPPISGPGASTAGRASAPPTPPAGVSGTGAPITMPPPTSGPTMMPGRGGMAAGAAAPPPAGAAGMMAAPMGVPLGPSTTGVDPMKLPTIKGTCPMIATGAIVVNNVMLRAWVGQKGPTGGPLIIYWHGTGGSAATAMGELDKTLVSETMASGGAIISMESGQQGNPIDWGVFTVGDFDIVDQAVACAIDQLKIDVRRIYTSGASAGGLAAGTLAYARSGYIAGSFPNSGGVAPWPGLNVFQDTTHIPAIFTMHGAKGKDTVVIEFADSSMQLARDAAAKGGFAVDCDHGGGHVAAPANLKAAAWTFLKAHPFGTKPSPYAGGLPADFPMYCKIIK